MTKDKERRKNWRTSWLSSIQEFADEASQRRLWLDPTNTNPHFSFVEYYCCYFDDLGLSDGGYDWAVNEKLLSEEEVTAVARFHQVADNYNSPTDDYDHKVILADAKWAEVVEAAQHAKSALLNLIVDPHEQRLLMEP